MRAFSATGIMATQAQKHDRQLHLLKPEEVHVERDGKGDQASTRARVVAASLPRSSIIQFLDSTRNAMVEDEIDCTSHDEGCNVAGLNPPTHQVRISAYFSHVAIVLFCVSVLCAAGQYRAAYGKSNTSVMYLSSTSY